MPDDGASCMPWLALDLETTGLSPTRHRIRELAVVPFSATEQEPGTRLQISPASGSLTSSRRSTDPLAPLVAQVVQHGFFLAHNAAFDLSFLAETLRRSKAGPFELRAFCTLRLARVLLPELRCHDLDSLREELGLGYKPSHTALQDARAVASLFQLLAGRFGLVNEDDLMAVHGPLLRAARNAAFGVEERPHDP